MKFRPVTKLDKRTSKNLAMSSCWRILMPLSFFQFMANLERFGSRIPDEQSIKLTFSLIVIFYLTKIESRTQKSLTQLLHYCFE